MRRYILHEFFSMGCFLSILRGALHFTIYYIKKACDLCNADRKLFLNTVNIMNPIWAVCVSD